MGEGGNKTPRFIADAMLGKLARWLRVMGYDTLYMQGDDHLIAARVRAEGRILLTRDIEFTHRKGLSVLHIDSQILNTQLSQVVQNFGLPPEGTSSRCMNCNGTLHPLTIEEACPLVPPYVAKTQRFFHQCSNCKRVYWRGTHWQSIQKLQNAVRQNVEEK